MSRDVTTTGTNQSGLALQVVAVGASQNVAYTDTAAASNALAATTSVVRVVATTNCYIAFGSAPVATTSSTYLPAGVVEYFLVTPGHKVSAIRLADNGTLNVSECS